MPGVFEAPPPSKIVTDALPPPGAALKASTASAVLDQLANFAECSLQISRLCAPSTERSFPARYTVAEFRSMQATLVVRCVEEFQAEVLHNPSVHKPASELLAQYGVALIGHCVTAVDAAQLFVDHRGYMAASDEGSPYTHLAEALHHTVVGLLLPNFAEVLRSVRSIDVCREVFAPLCALACKLDAFCAANPETARSLSEYSAGEAVSQALLVCSLGVITCWLCATRC